MSRYVATWEIDPEASYTQTVADARADLIVRTYAEGFRPRGPVTFVLREPEHEGDPWRLWTDCEVVPCR